MLSESTEEVLTTGPSIQKIEVSDLPSEIIKNSYSKAYSSNSMKSSNGSGSIRTDIPAVKIINEEGEVSYTLALQKADDFKPAESLYFQNLVIKELEDGKQKIFIFQYEPDESWFYDSQRDVANYSGKIKVFDIEGKRLGDMLIEKGNPAKIQSGYQKSSTTVDCVYELDYVWCWENPETGEFDNCSYHFEKECTYTNDGDTGTGTGGDSGGTTTGGTDSSDGGDSTTGGSSGGTDDGSGDDDGVDTLPLLEDTRDSEEEDKIDDSQLKDCHSKIIDTLKTIDTGVMGQMIQ